MRRESKCENCSRVLKFDEGTRLRIEPVAPAPPTSPLEMLLMGGEMEEEEGERGLEEKKPEAFEGLICETIKFSTLHIFFKLFIPCVGIKCIKPSPEFIQVRPGEMRHGFFNFLHCRHAVYVP